MEGEPEYGRAVGAPWRCLNCGQRLGTVVENERVRLEMTPPPQVELGKRVSVQCPICGTWRVFSITS